MKLLTIVTVALIPIIVSSSTLCKTPELECIELCCKKTQVYNVEDQHCEDMPEVAKVSWHTFLYDTKTDMEIVEYAECNGNPYYSTTPICYSPYYNMLTKQTALYKMSDVPCVRLLEPISSAWNIVYLRYFYLVLPVCLPIMTVYTCRKVEFISKLISWYLGSVAVTVLVMNAGLQYLRLEDKYRMIAKYNATMQYFAIASLLWQNVIGFQIWSGFKTANTRNDSDKDRKRFIYYSIYVWGIAAILNSISYLLREKTTIFVFKTSTLTAVPCFNMLTFVILSVNICVIRCGVIDLTNEVNFKLKLTLIILRLALVMGFPRMILIVLNQYFNISTSLFNALLFLEPALVFIVLVWKPKIRFKCNFGCCCCRKTEDISNLTEVVCNH